MTRRYSLYLLSYIGILLKIIVHNYKNEINRRNKIKYCTQSTTNTIDHNERNKMDKKLVK